jgi:hypothetical protein
MTAFNVVRFRVKPGHEEEFVEAHRNAGPGFDGFTRGALVNTGDRSYCFIGEWRDFDSIIGARPKMIGLLDSFREMLEDLGGDIGVTDPVSGEAVVEMSGKSSGGASRSRKRAKPAKRAAKPAKRAAKPARKARGSAARKATKKRSGAKRGKSQARKRR